MQYWLMKSEPDAYPWSKLVADGRGQWDGVRSHQAANNMKAMRLGDRAFFYHSNIGKEIVGVMEIVGVFRPDPTDPTGTWGLVDVAPIAPAKTPVTLLQMKQDKRLSGLIFLRQSRLSVSPVGSVEWKLVCKLAGIKA